MKELLFVCVLLHIHNSFCLKVIVSGSSKVATYNVEGNSLSPSAEWDVGVAGESMTWLQMDGDHIYAGHEVIEYQGQLNSVVSRWEVKDDGSSLERLEYVSTGSTGTTHINLDKDQGKVYAANYGGGTLSMMNLEADGSLDTETPASVVTYASLPLGVPATLTRLSLGVAGCGWWTWVVTGSGITPWVRMVNWRPRDRPLWRLERGQGTW